MAAVTRSRPSTRSPQYPLPHLGRQSCRIEARREFQRVVVLGADHRPLDAELLLGRRARRENLGEAAHRDTIETIAE